MRGASGGRSQRRRSAVITAALLTLAALAACGSQTPTPTAAPTASPSTTVVPLVTPRPSRPDAPRRSIAPTATPLAPDAEWPDVNQYFSGKVPAHSVVVLSADFEGSSWGSVMVAGGRDLDVSFRGETIAGKAQRAADPVFWVFEKDYVRPSGGPLLITNRTAAPIVFSGEIKTLTRRHLTVETSSLFLPLGQATFEVRLTGATAGDRISVTLRDPSCGACCARPPSCSEVELPATKFGTGHWTVQATLDEAGGQMLEASVVSPNPRYASVYLHVTTGNVSLDSGFEERLVDTDRDGYANELVITPEITAVAPASYDVSARLVNEAGYVVAHTTAEVALVAGSQPIDLAFDGSEIRDFGSWGPYRVVVTVEGSVMEISDREIGTTRAYDYIQFLNPRATGR